MRLSITNTNKKPKIQWTDIILIISIILILWQGLSMLYPPLILPSPALTFKSFLDILHGDNLLLNIGVTLHRLIVGLMGALLIGSIIGFFIGINKRIKRVLEPLIYILQSIPPILFMTLAMIWFGLDGQATIFIVFIVSLPIMAISIKEGFDNIDMKLIEMGKIFQFSRFKIVKEIIIPSLKTYFKSGLIILIGLGWKLVIMGEVLSSGTGLGSQITEGRLNLETNKVFAWSIIVIVLCYLSQKIIDYGYKLMDYKGKMI
ncbi:ABC transporter permease [Vallitalea sp.]|jgi:NitT/TauT family transport system permease protein|uniref:ABC transporter permease n=1 Tax=Vallitalea sp. TaxID=1882829 RepID=UPI0025FC3BEA|nr:ABC transporter permease [Vallitalea sp.]MCT4686211.1 ABC transporter permease [Vallitalea sp.]